MPNSQQGSGNSESTTCKTWGLIVSIQPSSKKLKRQRVERSFQPQGDRMSGNSLQERDSILGAAFDSRVHLPGRYSPINHRMASANRRPGHDTGRQ